MIFAGMWWLNRGMSKTQTRKRYAIFNSVSPRVYKYCPWTKRQVHWVHPYQVMRFSVCQATRTGMSRAMSSSGRRSRGVNWV